MTNKKLTHVALNAGRGVAALSGTLAVPTALTMLLQANLPAPALAKPDEAFFADRLAHKELQQQMRLERLDAKDLARDLRIQSRFDMNSARDVFSLTQNDLQGANSAQLEISTKLSMSATEFRRQN
jgi:type III secretory pathway lipoprotein EscJ